MQTILVTGGAGYIGSHTCVELRASGHNIVVLDNLSNASAEALKRLEQITGDPVAFVEGDILDTAALAQVFEQHRFDSVIHFAGAKAVGESVSDPLKYYANNVAGSLNLLQAMDTAGVRNIVFSSSATVYGEAETVPISEGSPLLPPTNPYGRTKLVVEDMLRDLCASDSNWNAILLRYFNPVGAHDSGLIGEDPTDIPNNLLPYVTQVAVGKREKLSVFGGDYPTPDGTAIRDYIHVVDLARGHVKAVDHLASNPGVDAINLGTGTGYSVLDVVKAFEQETGQAVPYEIVARRAGDVVQCFANPQYAEQVLGWRAERDLATMMRDAWRWQSQNPDGYR